MYAYIRGKVAAKGEDFVVLEVANIGYRIYVPRKSLVDLDMNADVLLHTRLQVREDDMSLFGFESREALNLFETLLSVSRVGPKLAISVLDAMSAPEFCRAILQNEISLLTRIPGVGRKTAQRLVLELKDKLSDQVELIAGSADGAGSGEESGARLQAISALVSLGYRHEEAAGAVGAALRQNPDLIVNESDLLREALKYLGSAR